MTKTLKVGDRALFKAIGEGRARLCTIVDVGTKNGQLVFDCELDDELFGETEYWGYADQFRAIK
jgi:hypothetical protein